ncbi:hypothetical protein FTV88_2775 [Heliorestis convoluta]|uniref:Uncharacterized protein n=1 Tax=Heliorestis convoluta TaxID=356322 RepID=A0A5Q2N0L9_9FIRM|nr:hypothetical protein FTV88_2775 [Heliorestis convoluta]
MLKKRQLGPGVSFFIGFYSWGTVLCRDIVGITRDNTVILT